MNGELNRVWQTICEKQAAQGHNALLEWEKIWLNVGSLLLSIDNGGLVSYFYNSYADRLSECLDALAKIGAMDLRTQLLNFCRLFPGHVPRTMEGRNDVINSWGDEVNVTIQEIDDETFPLLPDLERRLDEFVYKNIR